jgi:plastocyanin
LENSKNSVYLEAADDVENYIGELFSCIGLIRRSMLVTAWVRDPHLVGRARARRSNEWVDIMTRRTGMNTASNYQRRRITKLLVAATAALGFATIGAWSGDGSGVHSASSSTAVTAPAAVSVPRAPAATQSVTIANFAFSPASLTVSRGTTVTWTNNDSAPHNVRGGPLQSPTLNQGASYSHTFTSAGSFSYVCTFHPSMHGMVTVR